MSGAFSTTGQSFRNFPVPNFQPCVYTLSIRSPGLLGAEYASYTFPISPQMLRKEMMALGSVFDTQGTPAQNGVARLIDQYGLTPVTYTIEGTTGWQRHGSDGYILSGLQSIQVLQRFLSRYSALNAAQVAAGSPDLYTLEFYDYFSNDFWVVVPIGPQMFQQASNRTLYTSYRLRWVALKAVSAPIFGLVDALAQVFGTPATTAVLNAATTINGLLGLYSPTGELF
jgi:hypothetical protein